MEPTLVLADLHADPRALAAVRKVVDDPAFQDHVGPVDRVAVLGDVVGRGSAPGKLLSDLEDWEIEQVWIGGNHEQVLVESGRTVSGGDLARRAHQRLLEDKDRIQRLADLPDRRVLDGDVLLVHGGPVDPADLGGGTLADRTWQRIDHEEGPAPDGYHVTPKRALDALEDEVGEGGLLLAGHEHRELLLERRNGTIRQPDWDEIRLETGAGTLTGRTVDRRGDASLLARVGLGAVSGGEVRLGYLRGDRVHLLGLAVDDAGSGSA